MDEILSSPAPGPPWILGHRGSPLEAPENTLASLRCALDHGLDGVEYDLRACATGEPIVIHDETLDRTTSAKGWVQDRTLPELFGLDAGGWFDASFEGEAIPVLSEALDVQAPVLGAAPMHMIEIKDEGLVTEVARELAGRTPAVPVRVAAFERSICQNIRDAGLPAMLLAEHYDREDLLFARDERLAAVGLGPGGWASAKVDETWPFERWAWSVDSPTDLLLACRTPLYGFNTNEPRRALAVRSLVHWAPEDSGPYPVEAPELPVEPSAPETTLGGSGGQWCGRWGLEASVRNPFGWSVRCLVRLGVRRGAFEVEGLPAVVDLEAGQGTKVPFRLSGGSWSPGGDPTLDVQYRWDAGPGRGAGGLLLDAPMPRVRRALLGTHARRLTLLRESPGDPEASLTIRRHGKLLLCAIEHPGDLEEARCFVRLGTRTAEGGRGLRMPLPPAFDPEGCAFNAGVLGKREGREVIRRFSGGYPVWEDTGAAGKLIPDGTGS